MLTILSKPQSTGNICAHTGVRAALLLVCLGLSVTDADGQRPPVPSARETASAFDVSSRPFAAFSDAAMTMKDSLVTLARQQVGRRYRFGGTTPGAGFDCSGLVRYVAAALRISLPRTAAEQARSGTRIPTNASALQPGDLLAFGTGRISHVGIYVGNGRMVHASSRAGRVVETRVVPGLGRLPLRGARRVLAVKEPAPRDWPGGG